LSIDANLEGFRSLLRREPLSGLADRIERRLTNLRRRRSLDHQAQLELLALGRVRGEARAVPDGIDVALANKEALVVGGEMTTGSFIAAS